MKSDFGRYIDHTLLRPIGTTTDIRRLCSEALEYGMAAVSKPIHVNRVLREAGFLGIRVEEGGEILDVPQSRAFAVAELPRGLWVCHPEEARLERLEVDELLEGLAGLDEGRVGEALPLASQRRLGETARLHAPPGSQSPPVLRVPGRRAGANGRDGVQNSTGSSIRSRRSM